ncbi:MAG TPA: hypothetical protein VF100_06670, partial [Thermoanaerobaculia bacterium]
LPGVAELVVEPGGDVAAEAARRAALTVDLNGRLAALGAADLPAARALAGERAEAERDRQAARALLAETLSGGTREALSAAVQAAEAELAQLLGEATGPPTAGAPSAAGAPPLDPAAAEDAAAAAEAVAAEARRSAETARRALAEREQAHARAIAACRGLEARAEAAAARHRRARESAGRLVEIHAPQAEQTAASQDRPSAAGSQLALFASAGPRVAPREGGVPSRAGAPAAAAPGLPAQPPATGSAGPPPVAAPAGDPSPPAAAPSPTLPAALAAAEERVRLATLALDEARRRLAEAAPEAVAARVEAARQRCRRAESELREAELEHRERVTRLEAAGEAGLFERLQAARARHAHAAAAAAAVEARAAAAERLHRVLSEAREEARRTYSEPLRRAVEELGRPLFGEGFGVELDGELAIARRTLGGTTLRFDQLSSGAREQLALVARLACAMLVDRAGGGVPLIVDDALGLTDRDRLRAMGEVLSSVGERCQVIVLTSFPERYEHVRGARVVAFGGGSRERQDAEAERSSS